MPIHELDYYDMSADRGFLCRHNAADVTLSGDWDTAARTAMDLPKMLPTGRVRALLQNRLPEIDISTLAGLSDVQARKAMVHYSFMVQAYVWGEPDAASVLPPELAKPMVALADRLGQQPLLPYSGYVLDNWGLFDSDGAVTLDNIYMIQHFLAGQDEAWFVLVHVAIEAMAGGVLALMKPIVDAVDTDDLPTVQTHLEVMAGIWDKVNPIFWRMPERCDPYIYFERVRPFIHGWKDNPALPNGIIYEGVEAHGGQPQTYRGQTGSQSSIVPSMDALLGVGHAADPLKAHLDQLHIYRPPGHCQFIDDVRASSGLRGFVQRAGHSGLADAYNANLQAVTKFRTQHLEYAASYIHKQAKNSPGNDTDVGTGGTPFMKYLKKHRDETKANLVMA